MIPIRFEKRLPKTRRKGITPRRLTAAKRALKRQREKCPLFADQIAERQPTSEERIWNMDTQFVQQWNKFRQASCQKWLKLRRVIRKEICPMLKEEFLTSWSNSKYPACPYYTSDWLLQLMRKNCTSCPLRVNQQLFRCLYYSSPDAQYIGG